MIEIITTIESLIIILERFGSFLETQTWRALVALCKDALVQLERLCVRHGVCITP